MGQRTLQRPVRRATHLLQARRAAGAALRAKHAAGAWRSGSSSGSLAVTASGGIHGDKLDVLPHARQGREEEGRALGLLGGLDGLVALTDLVRMRQRGPPVPWQRRERHGTGEERARVASLHFVLQCQRQRSVRVHRAIAAALVIAAVRAIHVG